jgi:hypothetical protein
LSTAGPEVGDGIAIIRMTKVNREEARYGLPVYSMSKFRYMDALPSFQFMRACRIRWRPHIRTFAAAFAAVPDGMS